METAIQTTELKQEIAPVVARALEIVIRNPDERAAAVEFAKGVKALGKKAADFFRPMKQAADESKRRILDAEREALAPLQDAETMLKTKIVAYDTAAEQARLAEQRRLQAIADEQARREREKAEQEAAKQRAIVAEQERAAAELRRQAEQASAEERKRLQDEAAAAERKAAAAAVKVEAREEQAAAVVAPVIQVAATAKAKGESSRTLWKAKLTNKSQLIAAAASGNELAASFLAFDEVAANRFAAATKGAVPVSGVSFESSVSLAIKG
jgi:uncharacterized protein YhaN